MNCHTTTAIYTCDGTAALKPQAAGLRLIEGGAGRERARLRERSREQRVAPGLSRRQELAFALACAAAVAVLVFASFAADALASSRASQVLSQVPVETIVVSQGDSLWSIAQQRSQDGVSTAQLVSWIEDANGLAGSQLNVGERLVVPAAQLP